MYLERAVFELRHFQAHHPEAAKAIKSTPVALINLAEAANKISEGTFKGSLRLLGKIIRLGKSL